MVRSDLQRQLKTAGKHWKTIHFFEFLKSSGPRVDTRSLDPAVRIRGGIDQLLNSKKNEIDSF
jgi:hypothetical protein